MVYHFKNKQIRINIFMGLVSSEAKLSKKKNKYKHFLIILKLFEFYNLPEISNKRIIKYNFIHFTVFFKDWFILIFV